MGEPPVHSNKEFKSVKQTIQISRLFSFLKSSIRLSKVAHKSSTKELSANNAEIPEKKRDMDPHIAQGKQRSYTSFTIR